MLVTVTVSLSKRRLLMGPDERTGEGDPSYAPQNYVTHDYSFSFQSDDGYQPNPGLPTFDPQDDGSDNTTSETRRRLYAIVPPPSVNPNNSATWWSLPVGEDSARLIGGTMLTTERRHEFIALDGEQWWPLEGYYCEGEKLVDVDHWAGTPGRGTVIV